MNISTKYQGAILVVAFNRPLELRKCLKSIIDQGRSDVPLVVFFQTGNELVADVIQEFEQQIHHLVSFSEFGKSALENINLNRIMGYELCFKILKCDWVLAIEDDVELGFDSVTFVSTLFLEYKSRLGFRGINLGSYEQGKEVGTHEYSLLSYGLHGQAAAITKKTWSHFDSNQLLSNASTKPLDSAMETYLKTGFMVTPNRSRYADNGWNGTHAPKNPDDPYYQKLRGSWIGPNPFPVSKYRLNQINHSWRSDSRRFSRFVWTMVYLDLLRAKLSRFKKLIPGMKTHRVIEDS